MRINVLQMLKEPVGTRTRMELEDSHLKLDESDVLRDLNGTVDFMRTDRGLLVMVDAEAKAHGRCSRCLEEIEYPLELKFEDEYFPSADPSTGTLLPLEEDQDDEAFLINPLFDLDIDEALRQYKLLMDPLKLLCRPDCKGLCPVCGQNRNKGECDCKVEGDSPWEPLTGLQARLRGEERN